jgi:hypothetical protein
MYLAIAVENSKHPKNQANYRVWYLETDPRGKVVGIGVKSKNDVIQSLFTSYQKSGKTNWRAFTKESDASKPIEACDFISKNMHENTHFGNLPSLGDFQKTLNHLNMNFQINSIAS